MAKSFKKIINDKLVKPLLAFLKQGITPNKLALAVSLGFMLGLFPVFGVTTIFCAVLAFMFRINMAAIQLINYLVYPLQLILIIPLMHLGAFMFDAKAVPHTAEELVQIVANDMLHAISVLWQATLYGIAAWIAVIIPIGILIYIFGRIIFYRLAKSKD